MTISTYAIRRFFQAAAVLLVAAGLAVPAAAAAGKRAPDAFQRAVARHQSAAVPDVFERYAAAHPYGVGLTGAAAPTIVVHTSPGFSWTDAGIGAFGGLGIALALTGIALYARTTRTHHSSPAL
jgi:hypothetical protein